MVKMESALLHKVELLYKFAKVQYTEDYFLYNGWDCASNLPDLEPRDDTYKYALTKDGEVIGYFTYYIDRHTDTVRNFGVYMFDRHEPAAAVMILHHMKGLVYKHRRLEWAVVEGNPAKRVYENFCLTIGNHAPYFTAWATLYSAVKDLQGHYRDCTIFQIIKRW